MIKWNSRKFLAFVVWIIITVWVLAFKIEDKNGILQMFSNMTMIYMMGQAAIDGIERFKK